MKKNTVKCISVNIDCDTEAYQDNQSIQLAIRPEDIKLNADKSDTNVFEAMIKEIEFLGSYQRVYLEAIDVTENLIIVDLPNSNEQKINLVLNNKLNISFPIDNIRVYPN